MIHGPAVLSSASQDVTITMRESGDRGTGFARARVETIVVLTAHRIRRPERGALSSLTQGFPPVPGELSWVSNSGFQK